MKTDERIEKVFNALGKDPALRSYVQLRGGEAILDVVGLGVNPMWHTGHQSSHHFPDFDEAVEEVLHMVTDGGWEAVDSHTWGTSVTGRSKLTQCMDLARGDPERQRANQHTYPNTSAWFTYRDNTCDYACMATEYLFWLVTTVVGQQASRCNQGEWALCNREDVRVRDHCGYALVTGVSGAVQPITLAVTGLYAGPPACATDAQASNGSPSDPSKFSPTQAPSGSPTPAPRQETHAKTDANMASKCSSLVIVASVVVAAISR